ncbi:MAG: hypothetical protein Kow0075_15340 [Salibacteraceae bacterium]
MYISGHPLDDYEFEVKHFSNVELAELDDLSVVSSKSEARVAGIISDVEHRTSSKGMPYGRFTLEDKSGSFEFALFRDDYIRFKNYLEKDWCILATLKVESWFSKREQQKVERLSITNIELLSTLRDKRIKGIDINVPLHLIDDGLIDKIKSLSSKYRGKVPVQFNVLENGTRLEMPSRTVKLSLENELLRELDSLPEIEWSAKIN